MRRFASVLVFALAVAFAAQPASAQPKARATKAVKANQTRRAAPTSQKRVFLFVGMPGSGKSFVSKKLAEKLGLPTPLVSGDVIREAAGKAKNPKEQGERVLAVAREFAKKKGEIGRRMADKVRKMKGNTVIVEGFRNPHDLAAFRKQFPNTKVVSLEVPDALRHKRQLARGRAGEDNVAYLKKRDAQERSQGVDKLMKNAEIKVRVTADSQLARTLSTLSSHVAPKKQLAKQLAKQRAKQPAKQRAKQRAKRRTRRPARLQAKQRTKQRATR